MTRPTLAITDVKTTGLSPKRHEIIELGLLVVCESSFEVIDSLDVKVKPEHIETASKTALEMNGYNDFDWRDALTLEECMYRYSEKTKSSMFCAHNVTFDWGFINEALERTGVESRMDYHRLDIFTMAWTKLRGSNIGQIRLRALAEYYGLEAEPLPHRAINGARLAYEVFKRLSSTR